MMRKRKSFYRPLGRVQEDESHVWLLTFEQVRAGIARDLGQRSIARPAA
jgi:hypothetical protein